MLRRLLPLLLLLAIARPVRADEPPPPEDDASEHADLRMDRREHDFGISGQSESLETEFTYTNTSEERVTGIRVRVDCGCNKAELSKTELDPGESGALRVGFHTGTLSGRMLKRARITTADRARGEIVVGLRIAIVAGLVLEPGSLHYGDVLQGTKPSASFAAKWYEGVGTPFEITEARVPGHEEAFVVETRPYVDPTDGPWRGWQVEVTFKEPPPVGMYSAELLLRTTAEKYERLTLPLSAHVCGKVWMQARSLTFGFVRAGTARTATLKFRPFDPSVSFGEVSAKARNGLVQVEVQPDPRHADKGYWRLSATVPADAEPGSLDGEVIELYTGVEGEEMIPVTVKGRVVVRRSLRTDDR